jgi:hypothetical protein
VENDLRRARRALWAFRLIFYPGAVIVALLLLSARSTAGEEQPRAGTGETSQRRPIALQVRDGHVTRFITQIEATCPDGRSYKYAWTADYIGAGGHVRERFGRRWNDGVVADVNLTMRARVDHGVVTGTLRMLEKRPDVYDCDSGVVSFSARAD